MKLIRNSLLTSCAFFLIHFWYVSVNIHETYIPQQLYQANRIKAQEYLYDNAHPNYPVIVGSSLSALLVKDSLPSFFNLGFSSQSIYDGFACIKKKNTFPRFLFIETNGVWNKENTAFTSSLLSTAPFLLRKKMYFLQDRFQPVSILGTKLVLPMVKALTGYLNPESNDSGDVNLKENKSVFFQKMVNENLKRDGKLPTDAEFNKYLASLHEWVDLFKKNNVRIVFFEMPEDEKLKNAPGAIWIRKAIMNSFPPSEYLYLPDPENMELHTTDGKHLDKNSAKIYSAYFRKEALKIMQAN